jgi:hypothetical protein
MRDHLASARAKTDKVPCYLRAARQWAGGGRDPGLLGRGGSAKALLSGLSWLPSLLLGVVTAVGGGVGRVGDRPAQVV